MKFSFNIFNVISVIFLAFIKKKKGLGFINLLMTFIFVTTHESRNNNYKYYAIGVVHNLFFYGVGLHFYFVIGLDYNMITI